MPARAAATVVLLRDTAEGMEVFMVKRHGLSDVLGGAYVFPGGKVDRADTDPLVLKQHCAPLDELQAALAGPELETARAAGFFLTACRETFEEAGVLLAEGATVMHLEVAKKRVQEGLQFAEMLAQLNLRPDWGNVVPWSRWITPLVPAMINKRFDARFFLWPQCRAARRRGMTITKRPRASGWPFLSCLPQRAFRADGWFPGLVDLRMGPGHDHGVATTEIGYCRPL